MLLISGIKSQFLLFFLVLFASHAIHAIHAQSADACKAGACLDFRSLSASCGYDIDLDQSRAKTYDETIGGTIATKRIRSLRRRSPPPPPP
ncbi:uncharacterized protein H6S33_011380 [Morchella sextelata]|uniref:uncharacterized protein n=1 Tax=Morchella sextelata TaxID=1174677 RepID=UPI001D0524A4|nr:uncharacterized protein H6S33_011380 [Morchella sextelata]KAH0610953.1 hypothetical protein H6S33_011380 [Morchella sextelata]